MDDEEAEVHERKFKMDVGTIGSAACEIALNRILISLEDPKLTRKIMSRHNQIREGLKKLEVLKNDRGFFLSVVRIYYQDHIRKFEEQRFEIPPKAYTHALCCFKALYRRAILKPSSEP